MTQHDTATSRTFLKVTLHPLFFTKTDETIHEGDH